MLRFIVLPVILLSLVASTQVQHPAQDGSTYSNINQIVTTHFHLDISVDFNSKSLYGNNTLSLKAVADGVKQVVLDIQGINITAIFDKATQKGLLYNIVTPDADLGSALIINLTTTLNTGDTVDVIVTYTTLSSAQAFSWLNPAQTSSKTLNYMFTQCEPIHCRSVAPLQDTPAIKTTYSALVTVDQPYVVKMSANESAPIKGKTNITYSFTNSIPIPSYLLAIAVGNLTYQSLGYRTGVITEPSFMPECASELSDLETYLDKAEEYLTPYIWGNYTILVLPPSFPYGGMENPLLTFASPTIIVGDKSQVYVATHEICHSWTGNDVTCQNWSNMWLNEGFTVFEERHVSGELYGQNFALCEAILGNASLYNDINNYGVTNSYSSLYPILNGHSPDDSFSNVPYEKGYQFLYYLNTFITDDQMQQFLQTYIELFGEQSLDYTLLNTTWVNFVKANITNETLQNEILQTVNWTLWVEVPGYPPVIFNFSNPDSIEATNLADQYIALKGLSSPSAQIINDYKNNWYSNKKVIFLTELINRQDDVTFLILQRIDLDLDVTNDKDPEVKQRWYPLGIGFHYQPVFEPAHSFVSTQGRMKYLNPIYQALCDYGYRNIAYQWYQENLDFYHPIAIATLQGILLQQAYVPTQEHLQLFKQRDLFLQYGGRL